MCDLLVKSAEKSKQEVAQARPVGKQNTAKTC